MARVQLLLCFTILLASGCVSSTGSFGDTTGSSSDMGSPSGSPSSSPSGSSSSAMERKSGSTSSSTNTNGGKSSSGNVVTSQSSSSVTVQQVEATTAKEVTTFIMNLEKKCPQKEEFKAFFSQLKGTMIAPPKQRQGLFSRIKSAAGKVSGAMNLIRSRIGGKSAEVKKSLETYQGQVMKTLQELQTIHRQIVSQNKGKREGSLKCTPEQAAQIKLTITKWEKVTTQFVETAAQSEKQSSSTSSSSGGQMISN